MSTSLVYTLPPAPGTLAPPLPPVFMSVSFYKETASEKCGIGIGVRESDGSVVVTFLREGAAEYTSLRRGHKIVSINGKPIKSSAEAVKILTKAVGTVTVVIVLPVVTRKTTTPVLTPAATKITSTTNTKTSPSNTLNGTNTTK